MLESTSPVRGRRFRGAKKEPFDSRATPGSTGSALAPEPDPHPHARRGAELVTTASVVSLPTPPGPVAGARALLCRSLHGERSCHARAGCHRAGAGVADTPGCLGRRGGPEPVGHGERAAGFCRPQRGAALHPFPARGRGLEACAAKILRPQGLSAGAGVVEGARPGGHTDRLRGPGDTGPRAYRGRGAARPVRAVAGAAHQPGVRCGGPTNWLGVDAGAAPRGVGHGQRHFPGNGDLAAGFHVPAVGLCRVERRDRDLSFSPGFSLAGAGSGARLVGDAADPFPFHGRADVPLHRGRFARVRGGGCAARGEERALCPGRSSGDTEAALACTKTRTNRAPPAASCCDAFGTDL
jgi:hypothetical protein